MNCFSFVPSRCDHFERPAFSAISIKIVVPWSTNPPAVIGRFCPSSTGAWVPPVFTPPLIPCCGPCGGGAGACARRLGVDALTSIASAHGRRNWNGFDADMGSWRRRIRDAGGPWHPSTDGGGWEVHANWGQLESTSPISCLE